MTDTPNVAGAKLYIGGTAAIDYTSENTALAAFISHFDASPPYPEVANISNLGNFGSVANVLSFPVLSDDFVPKGKGTRNAGDPPIVVGRLSDDEGQIALRAAEKTKYFYNFKLELADAQSELYSNTIIYFRALVAGAENGLGGNEDFVTETYTLGIYPRPIIDESALLSP